MAGLKAANIDFSGPNPKDLKDWLGDPAGTPYPAITKVLLTLLGPKHLIKSAYIDVISNDYEPNEQARKVADVNVQKLQAAVVAAVNRRNGTNETDFWKMVTP